MSAKYQPKGLCRHGALAASIFALASLAALYSEASPPDKQPTRSLASIEAESRKARVGGAAVEGARPSFEEFAGGDLGYEELLHWRNRRKWGTATTMGDPVNGHLPGGVALDFEGKHHAVLTYCRGRATHFGAPRLLDLIHHAAREVHGAIPGPRLMVCNMSIEGGGAMRWSRSHAAGRDVDFAFFMNKADEPYEPRGLLTFERGLKRIYHEEAYTFDVPRNWLLVKSLLSHPTIEVQWIFMANHLRRALLNHAEAIGEPLDLLIRARQIVRQPLDSTPHDDHIHVRIYCDPAERIHGCRDKEPYWPWIGLEAPKLQRRAAALSLGLRDKNKDMRALAFERIEARRLYDAAPAIVETALMDPDGDLQARAINLVVEWDQRHALLAHTLEVFLRAPGGGILKDDPDFTGQPLALPLSALDIPHQPWEIGQGHARRPAHIRRAYIILGRLGTTEAAGLLKAAIRSRRLIENGASGLPEALLAAQAARHVMSTDLVPALIDALTHERDEVRTAAQEALERITNHSLSISIGARASRESLDEGARKWRAWWTPRADKTRDALLLEGFESHGVKIASWDKEAILPTLVSAMKHPDPVAYNADRVLSWLTGRRSVLDADSKDKHRRWKEWIGDGD